MKKYNSLSQLLRDYREAKNLTQLDLAAMLDVDVKTIGRWEKGTSLIKVDKEDDVVEALFLPHQVIHNLNSEHPISIYYDIDSRTYSFSLMGSNIINKELFLSGLPVEEERIHTLTDEDDIKFVEGIQSIRTEARSLDRKLIKMASEALPDLNLILFDQAGFYAGHISFLPLKHESLQKIRNKEIQEYELNSGDFENDERALPRVFYFYSLYADNITNAYYLMSQILKYFKNHEYKDYKIAGMAYHPQGLEMHREMGLKVIWQEEQTVEGHPIRAYVEGNYDMFIFGKMK